MIRYLIALKKHETFLKQVELGFFLRFYNLKMPSYIIFFMILCLSTATLQMLVNMSVGQLGVICIKRKP